MGEHAIEVEGLAVAYGEVRAVDGVDLTVGVGEFIGILGPNGAGKTTLLETVEGLRRPDAGNVRVLGEPVWPRNPRLLPRVGVQLQASSFFERLTAREQLGVFASLYGVPAARVDDWLERVGLTEKAGSRVEDLSGGQAQRLSIACALVHDPEVLFLDEPTASLDPQARRNLWDLLAGLHEEGRTVVLTTHHMDEAERLADRIHIIDRGKVIATGTPAELTRGGRSATIRLVVNRPFPEGAPESLRAELGPDTEVRQLDEVSMLIHGPADSTTLGLVSRWCEAHDVLPESLHLGQRTLEDVFLDLTGRELAP